MRMKLLCTAKDPQNEQIALKTHFHNLSLTTDVIE